MENLKDPKPGDSKPDLRDPSGKEWLLKKNESIDQLEKRALDDLSKSKNALGDGSEFSASPAPAKSAPKRIYSEYDKYKELVDDEFETS